MHDHSDHRTWRWHKYHDCEDCHEVQRAYDRQQFRVDGVYQRAKAKNDEQLLRPDTAGRRYSYWTSDELEIALDEDLTMGDKLELLERTYWAIRAQIERYRRGVRNSVG